MSDRRNEEDFRAWVRTLNRLPAEIDGRETWNAAVIMDAIDKLSQPLPKN